MIHHAPPFNRRTPRYTLPTLMAALALLLGNLEPNVEAQTDTPMNEFAERYVKLVLALGQHDPDSVDAYYGPEQWQVETATTGLPLDQIADAADGLAEELRIGFDQDTSVPTPDAPARLRHQYLQRQLQALAARVHMLTGRTLPFDDESDILYDAVAPHRSETYFSDTLIQLERTLPGDGSLIDRYTAFRAEFEIPPDRINHVFDAAIAECRRRTLAHVDLPGEEEFSVEYVTDKPWSGYNWYQGGFRSLIQVNTDLPIHIVRAIDLACHEGYPGHHVYNVLLERHLVRDRGWPEFSVYPLFSPQSLIAEGTANYGIEITFSEEERLDFERDVLFPAAGLDGSRATRYYEIQALVARLDYAGNEAARRYLNGEIDRAAATNWLSQYALMDPARAEQRTQFFDHYRSYVINYNLGKDLVAAFIERTSDGTNTGRWQAFTGLLASPRLPSGLRE